MQDTSVSRDDVGLESSATEVDGGVRLRHRRVATDGGTDADYYGMHSYNFAWYWTKQIGWRRALLGTILLATSFLIVPGLILLGYAYRVGRATARGEAVPPAPDDWAALAKDGARFAVLAVPAALLFVIPLVGAYVGLAVLAGFLGTGRLTDPATYTSAVQLVFSVSYLVSFIEYLVYVGGLWILSFVVIGVGWLLGPGFAVVSSGAYLGFMYHQTAADGAAG